MILFLNGPDDYRREERKRFLIDQFLKKYPGSSIERFSADSKEGREKFHEFTISPSLFGDKRLALLDDLFETDDAALMKDLKNVLENPLIWVFISEREKIPAAYKFLLKKPVTAEEYPFLEEGKWREFISTESKKRGLTLNSEAMNIFLSYYKDDTWRLITELDRLSSKKGAIQKQDAQLEKGKGFNLWGMLNQLKGSSRPQRLAALERILGNGEPAAKIFNILATQAGSRVQEFADWDVQIKSGKLEYEEVLLEFVLK
ncbi:MAG: hypothetical protein AAB691_02095 [Patescibacteria group bacterium]